MMAMYGPDVPQSEWSPERAAEEAARQADEAWWKHNGKRVMGVIPNPASEPLRDHDYITVGGRVFVAIEKAEAELDLGMAQAASLGAQLQAIQHAEGRCDDC